MDGKKTAMLIGAAAAVVLPAILTRRGSNFGVVDLVHLKKGVKRAAALKARPNPSEMSAAAINKEADAVYAEQSTVNDLLIEDGRGHETNSTLAKQTDPLAQWNNALTDRAYELKHEMERRGGPGTRRLPKGFGPIKRF